MGAKQPAGVERDRRRWLRERERRLAATAEKQHGVIARRQLLELGISARATGRRLEAGRLQAVHRGVFAVGHSRLTARGHWMAAVLACGDGALLSHRSAARLWGLMRSPVSPVEVTGRAGRRRPGITQHEGGITDSDRAVVAGIPVTSVARTLLDLADVLDERRLEKAWEEADRLGLLRLRAVEEVCARGHGRRGLKPLRRLVAEARAPEPGRTPLEDKVVALCRRYRLPMPQTNVEVLGHEVDAFWPQQKVTVEADSWSFHRHRAAFERDRKRDAAMLAAGYRVVRLTHRRMQREPDQIATELGRLLESAGERGQGTVEWVGLLAAVALLLLALVAANVRVPGAALAHEVGATLLCAAALAERCGDEPTLIAAYGDEVGRLVREHMPSIAFERGSRALPVDFRRCRTPTCGDGTPRGLVRRTDAGLPITAFVRVIDCREGAPRHERAAPDCAGERAGNLYIQYWLYFVDSATMRGVPVAGSRGYHADDWESAQVRIRPGGRVDERASSHHGYNHAASIANAGADTGVEVLRDLAERLGARPRNGWGPSEGMLRVSGGSHAGNAEGYFDLDRIAPAPSIHLVPLEPIAAAGDRYRFAVTPPWRKRAWTDPEAAGTE